ncbi:Uncharacterised protein [Mycobacteroides abscessus]|nr:Uncharacterised protein [Mycobacteroides abscessus]
MAALAALHLDVEDHLLAREVDRVARPLEPGEAVHAHPAVPVALVLARRERVGRVARRGVRDAVAVRVARRVDEVDPPVVLELRVERDALEAVLGVRVDVERRDHARDARRRVGEPHVAVAGRVQDARVREDREVDGLAHVLRQQHALVVGPVERRLGTRFRAVVDAVVRDGRCRRRAQAREREGAGGQSRGHPPVPARTPVDILHLMPLL